MDKSYLLFSFSFLLIIGILAYGLYASVSAYYESENFCKSLGQEMTGWKPDRAVCDEVKDGYVVRSTFERMNGTWYPVKEKGENKE